ncbi:MAG: hypothetical protein H7317_10850 [Pseudorhodobacter sp.]|nr:hypothetical protein [Pseudorhodobacter sp.]
MTETPLIEPELPPSLRFLKHLVTVLMITMIVGVITVVGLLVTRMPQVVAPPVLPASLTLPAGVQPRAVTMGTGWIAVVTSNDHILVFANDGKLRQDIPILLTTD